MIPSPRLIMNIMKYTCRSFSSPIDWTQLFTCVQTYRQGWNVETYDALINVKKRKVWICDESENNSGNHNLAMMDDCVSVSTHSMNPPPPKSILVPSTFLLRFFSKGQDYKEKHKLDTNLKLAVLNNTKLRHFWAQIVSRAPRHARKTFIVLAPSLHGSLFPWPSDAFGIWSTSPLHLDLQISTSMVISVVVLLCSRGYGIVFP